MGADLKKKIKIRLVYRNYKPLHPMFDSILKQPPTGIEYVIDSISNKTGRRLKKHPILFKLYRVFGKSKYTSFIVGPMIDRLLFLKNENSSEYDLTHYINLLPKKHSKGLFVVEFEHPAALTGFSPRGFGKTKQVLTSVNCKAIICPSQAARGALKRIMKDDFRLISTKVFVVYPARERVLLTDRVDIGMYPKIRILFVGNDSFRKGFEELILSLNSMKPDTLRNFKLTVISNDTKEVIDKYSVKNLIELEVNEPNFTKDQIVKEFYLKSDLLVFPTKRDTFGFSIIDSLSCGTPVLATDQFAIPEMITDKKEGLLINLSINRLDKDELDLAELMRSNIDETLVEGIKSALIYILSNKEMLHDMSRAALSKFKPQGKFSIEAKNKKLLDIYEGILR